MDIEGVAIDALAPQLNMVPQWAEIYGEADRMAAAPLLGADELKRTHAEAKKAEIRAKMHKDNDFAAARNARVAETAGKDTRSVEEKKADAEADVRRKARAAEQSQLDMERDQAIQAVLVAKGLAAMLKRQANEEIAAAEEEQAEFEQSRARRLALKQAEELERLMKRERARALRADILAEEARRADLDRRAGRKPKISKIAPPPEDLEDLETLQVWLKEKEAQQLEQEREEQERQSRPPDWAELYAEADRVDPNMKPMPRNQKQAQMAGYDKAMQEEIVREQERKNRKQQEMFAHEDAKKHQLQKLRETVGYIQLQISKMRKEVDDDEAESQRKMELIARQEAEHKAKLAAAQKALDDRAAYRKRLREQLGMESLTTKEPSEAPEQPTLEDRLAEQGIKAAPLVPPPQVDEEAMKMSAEKAREWQEWMERKRKILKQEEVDKEVRKEQRKKTEEKAMEIRIKVENLRQKEQREVEAQRQFAEMMVRRLQDALDGIQEVESTERHQIELDAFDKERPSFLFGILAPAPPKVIRSITGRKGAPPLLSPAPVSPAKGKRRANLASPHAPLAAQAPLTPRGATLAPLNSPARPVPLYSPRIPGESTPKARTGKPSALPPVEAASPKPRPPSATSPSIASPSRGKRLPALNKAKEKEVREERDWAMEMIRIESQEAGSRNQIEKQEDRGFQPVVDAKNAMEAAYQRRIEDAKTTVVAEQETVNSEINSLDAQQKRQNVQATETDHRTDIEDTEDQVWGSMMDSEQCLRQDIQARDVQAIEQAAEEAKTAKREQLFGQMQEAVKEEVLQELALAEFQETQKSVEASMAMEAKQAPASEPVPEPAPAPAPAPAEPVPEPISASKEETNPDESEDAGVMESPMTLLFEITTPHTPHLTALKLAFDATTSSLGATMQSAISLDASLGYSTTLNSTTGRSLSRAEDTDIPTPVKPIQTPVKPAKSATPPPAAHLSPNPRPMAIARAQAARDLEKAAADEGVERGSVRAAEQEAWQMLTSLHSKELQRPSQSPVAPKVPKVEVVDDNHSQLEASSLATLLDMETKGRVSIQVDHAGQVMKAWQRLVRRYRSAISVEEKRSRQLLATFAAKCEIVSKAREYGFTDVDGVEAAWGAERAYEPGLYEIVIAHEIERLNNPVQVALPLPRKAASDASSFTSAFLATQNAAPE